MSVCKTRPPHAPAELRRGTPVNSAEPAQSTVAHATAPIRILRLAQVIEATGLGKTKIYELQATGQFPMRVQITAHSVGWVENEVQMWLLRRVGARPAAASRTI